MSYLSNKIQFYPADIRQTKPIGSCTLGQLLDSIRLPKPDILELFDEIANASIKGDKKLKDELKSKLYYLTPCIVSDGTNRTYSAIERFTGLMVLDFDNLEQELAVELRDHLFETYPFIIASMLSSSRKGVKCIVRIPVVESVEEFKLYFYGLATIMEVYRGWDSTSQNSALAFYLTYDFEAKVREDAAVWSRTGYKEDEFKAFTGDFEVVNDVSEADRQQIIKQITSMFASIVDSGHGLVRSACLIFGGFVGAGYYSYDEAIDILDDLVDNTPYLQAKPRTYKKTCRTMVLLGSKSPLFLDRHSKE